MEKNGRKNTHYGHFRGSSPGTGSALFSISTSFRILAITFSVLIRFECFKILVKIDFKENPTSRNRHCQILILGGLKIYSK